MQKTPCPHCGTSQINHTFARVDGYIELLTGGMNRTVSQWKFSHYLGVLLEKSAPYFFDLFALVGIVRWNTDVSKVSGARGQVLWRAAEAKGVTMRSVVLLGFPIDVYDARRDGKRFFYACIPMVDDQKNDVIWWIDDKAALKKKLIAGGIPVARGGGFSSWSKLRAAFADLHKPVIIKPQNGSRGRHTTTAIYTEAELLQAWNIAREISRKVVMEEHLVGSVYRGTLVDGKLVAVLRGDPPRVTGDGVHTIAELVEIENAKHADKVLPIVVTPEHVDFLMRNGYTLETVLTDGVRIDVLSKVGISYGGMSAEMTPRIHPKVREYLNKAGGIVVYPVVGFDFIIEDVTLDPDTQRWGIIEANSTPFVQLHHFPVEGEPVDVASAVWSVVEKSGQI